MDALLNMACPEVNTLLLIFVRVGICFAVLPIFGSNLLPRRISAMLALFLSLVLLPVVGPVDIDIQDMDVFFLLIVLVQNLLVGLCLGLSINIIFSGAQVAGQLVGFQMGFAMANVLDPMTGATAPVTANLLYVTAILIFFALGGHYFLIRGLVESFTLVPIAAEIPRAGFFSITVAYGSKMFLIALKVASPVIAVLLLMNVSFALVARAVPQMNVFIMSFPLTIAVGLIFITVVIKMLPFFLEAAIADAWGFIKAAMSLF
ncbi:MAG: flagellar biosynthetic protein FliR [Thermodesulfobacteriota bacterium]|nr:flagellar biosynthetic protein FliR [Thermodesulfobacteriota bacterium]